MIIDTFFTTKGRIGRLSFLFRSIAFILLMAGIVLLTGILTKSEMAIFMAYVVMTFLSCIAYPCLTAQRLHDVNLSGWWQIIFYVPWVLFPILNPDAKQQIEDKSFEWDIIDISLFAIPFFLAFCLALWPGTREQNKYDF